MKNKTLVILLCLVILPILCSAQDQEITMGVKDYGILKVIGDEIYVLQIGNEIKAWGGGRKEGERSEEGVREVREPYEKPFKGSTEQEGPIQRAKRYEKKGNYWNALSAYERVGEVGGADRVRKILIDNKLLDNNYRTVAELYLDLGDKKNYEKYMSKAIDKSIAQNDLKWAAQLCRESGNRDKWIEVMEKIKANWETN